jgi:hypothetical protein
MVAAGLLVWGVSANAGSYIPNAGDNQLLELDGNVDYDGVPSTGVDWSNYTTSTHYYQSTLIHDNDQSAPYTPGERYDENIWDQGSKDTQQISEWKWKNPNNHKATDKVDIVNATAAIFEKDGDMIIYLQADRYANDGDAYLGAWLFRNKITPLGDGTFDGEHQDGDLLMLANFTGGGVHFEVLLYQWKNGALDENPVSGYGFAIANDGNTPASSPYNNYSAKTSNKVGDGVYPDLSFFEGGVNLSKFYADIGMDMPCFTTIMIESRNSSSVDAALEDFVIDNDFSTCDYSIAKECIHSELNAAGDGVNYDYNITVTNEGFGTMTLSLTDNGGTPNDTGDDYTWSDVTVVDKTVLPYQILNAPLNLTNTVTAQGVAEKSATENCTAVVDTNVTVTKTCKTTLQGVGGYTVVRVDFNGTVCNSGNAKVNNIYLTDTTEGETGYAVDLNQTYLLPGECATYTGVYYPKEPLYPCAKDNTQHDEIYATYDVNLTGATETTMPAVAADCALCDSGCVNPLP